MRLAASVLALGLASLLLATPAAHGDGGEDEASSDDLLASFRPFYGGGASGGKWGKGTQDVPWTDWWYANRRELLTPSYRAATTTAAVAPEDPKARSRARDTLLAALATKDRLLASEAAIALGRLGDPRDIPALAAIVSDRDISATRRLHKFAALALGMMPTGDAEQATTARDALLGAVASAKGHQDEFSYFWTNCAYALAMRGDVSALPKLINLREDGLSARNARSSIYIEVLGGVSYALAALGGDLALPEIEEHLAGRKAPDGGANDTSWAATQALARVKSDASRAVLMRAARDDRTMVRLGALQALGAVAIGTDDDAARVLREALADDRDLDCRQMAAASLGRQGHTTAAAALLQALDSGRSEVRTFAAVGLGLLIHKRPDPAVSAALTRAIAKASADEQQGALSLACGLGGVTEAVPMLTKFLDNGSGTAGPAAAWALGQLGGGGTAALRVLRNAATQSGNPLLRREAVLALGTIRDPDIVSQLRAIAASKTSDRDRATAVVCLGRVGSDADLDFLVDLLEDRRTGDGLRPCVIHAIGWIVDRTDYGRLARVAADVKWTKQVRGVSMSWTGDAMWDIQHLVD